MPPNNEEMSGSSSKSASLMSPMDAMRDNIRKSYLSSSLRSTGLSMDRDTAVSNISDAAAAARNRNTTSAAREMALSDPQLLEMATEAGSALQWDVLQNDLLSPGTNWKRKKGSENIAVYSRTDTKTETYAVVAVSELPCCAQELQRIVSVANTTEYTELMRAMWGRQFMYGDMLHEVDLQGEQLQQQQQEEASQSATASADPTASSTAAQLSVKTVVFEKSNVFGRNEEWFYLDLVQDKDVAGCKRNAFTRTLLSLHPDDVYASETPTRAQPHRSSGVFVGYTFDEEPSGRLTRVRMYAECSLRNGGKNKTMNKIMGRNGSTQRMVKNRLQQLTQTPTALLKILRRRRLGFQVMIDTRLSASLLSVSLPKCGRCTRSFLMVKQKMCNLCGNIVCDNCSGMHERERVATNKRPNVDSVRVCHRCMDRVDAAVYRNVAKEDLKAPRVVSDRSSGAVLTDLLEESLKGAPDASARCSVMNVIKDMIDLEVQHRRSSTDSLVSLTAESSEEEHLNAMRTHLNGGVMPLDECVLGGADSRAYVIEPSENPKEALPWPLPKNEAHRLEIISKMKKDDLHKSPELEIICSIAAKELGCMATLVTVVENDTYHVVSSNVAEFSNMVLPRNEGFCNQLIMEDKPLLVPHPEADVRFSNMGAISAYNINYYCGFPLKSADNTVIGSVCCLDQTSKELTQSQYTSMQRLARTASRVVQRNT